MCIYSQLEMQPINLIKDLLLEGVRLPESELYFLLGADEGISAILNDYYDRMFADEDLEPYFEGIDQEKLRQKQITYFVNHLLGRHTHTYKENILRSSHRGMNIPSEHYEHAIRHINAAMRNQKVSLEARVKVETLFRTFKPHIAER